MERVFETIAQRVANWAGRPIAFITAFTVVLLWGLTGPVFHYSDTWQLVINTSTTIVTFLMVFLIQNAQNRDASAIQAKLDELLRAVDDARPQFIGIEHLTEHQIELVRRALERQAVQVNEERKDRIRREKGKRAEAESAEDSVDRLLDRF